MSAPCILRIPAGALPDGAVAKIEASPVDPALAPDVLGDVTCRVTLPSGVVPTIALGLGITTDATAAGRDVTIVRVDGRGVGTRVPSTSTPSETQALVTTAGVFAITERPGAAVGEAFATDALASDTLAARLRNLGASGVFAAHFDGTRFYLGSGSRVLVWSHVPAVGEAPELVLGQPSFDAAVPGRSASLLGAPVVAVWGDGQKLVVAAGNRVLVWSTFPKASFAPADLVLGQPSFGAVGANTGGVSASSMSTPTAIDSDGQRLVVADRYNHRFLVWDTFPTESGQPASRIVGQPSASSNGIGLGATPVYEAWGAALAPRGMWLASMYTGTFFVASPADNPAFSFRPVELANPLRVTGSAIAMASSVAVLPSGGLAIGDWLGRRVGVLRSTPSGAAALDAVLGQPDGLRVAELPTSGSTLDRAALVSPSSRRFTVVDRGRALVWDDEPSYDFQPAARAIGQAGLTTRETSTDYRRISGATLADPSDVAVSGNTLAVADRSNNRVVLHTTNGDVRGPVASVVLGQPDATSFVANGGGRAPSATTMSGPSGVALGGGRLVVADTENHRVLVWSSVPAKTNAPADLVLGQPDFAGGRPNRGHGDLDADGHADADASTMFSPTGVATDGVRLAVADRLNHRVLVWSSFPTSSGQAPDLVLGQQDATSTRPNHGAGPFVVRPDGFDLPSGVGFASGALWVADTENNRVVRYDGATPSAFVGQPDGATNATPNAVGPATSNVGMATTPVTTTATVLRPRAVAVAGGRLYVSETASNRVHVLDAGTLAPVQVLGQPDAASAAANAGGLGAASLRAPLGIASDGARLWLADSENHRVLGFALAGGVAAAAATAVLGQPTFLQNGFDGAVSQTAKPRSVHRDGGELFVAEADRHRIAVYALPLVSGAGPVRIYGQPSDGSTVPNAGGAPSNASLAFPSGVFADAQRLVVADTGNHRVLVSDRTGGPAKVVLGQADFSAALPNRGGAAGAATLRSPSAVFYDGARLYVADAGNHRVLVWNAMPVKSGTPADVVLGQPAFDAMLANGGAGAASASTMSSPSAALVRDGTLFVADADNNRVLAFDVTKIANGASADAVLGQPSATSRTSAVSEGDLEKLAGPVGLAVDAANLYVGDRDVPRVVVFDRKALGARAQATLGSASGVDVRSVGGLAAETSPLFTTRLYVAETSVERLFTVSGVSRLR